MKHCSKCDTTKELDEFYKRSKSADRKDSYCKACRKEENRLYNLRNRERLNRYQNDYYWKNRDRIREQAIARERAKAGIIQ